ncbi:MAG TPA: hypothetical protein VEL51_15855 [Vicinamibacterales bacterium]|nr:hypothetical protein [Vicinamibacterales bacterium]
MEGRRELLDFASVEVGHARVQEWRRFVGCGELRQKGFLPLLQAVHARLQLRTRVPLDDGVDDLLDLALHPLQLALGTTQAGPVLHAQPIHLLRELAAELLEEVLAHQLVLERPQHALLDFLTRDRQLVGAGTAIASPEASEVVARVDDEPGAAFAALRETREQILWPAELVEASALLARLPLPLNARVSRLYCLPDFIVDDSQLGHVLRDPLRRRIRPGDTLAGIWILQETLPIPHQTTDVQLVVENANASLRISVNRARAPERPTRTAHTFGVESLRDLFR